MRVMQVALVAVLVCALLAVDTTSAVVVTGSCMLHRLYKAGIPHAKSVKYEGNMIATSLTEKKILGIHADVLIYLLRSDLNDARNLQDCIAKQSDQCSKYDPCRNGGECQLNDRKSAYVCVCHSEFTGKFCTTPHPAPVGEFQVVKKKVNEMNERLKVAEGKLKVAEGKLKVAEGKLKVADGKWKIADQKWKVADEKLKFHGTGCSSRSLGYKYQSRHSINDGRDKGVIATMTFIKKYAFTVLRLSYSANIRMHGHGVSVYYRFKIDGQECKKPSKIDINLHNIGDFDYVPAVLQGVCEESNAGPIARGQHTISVHVYSEGDAFSGHLSTSIMEVQEMCPQF